MNPFFRTLTIVITLLLTVYMVGCDPDNEETSEVPIAAFVRADPPTGDIDVDSIITVTFDNVPEDVKVDTGGTKIGKIIVAGQTVTINGPFAPGALSLTITWTDGVQTLNYTVTSPQVDTFPDEFEIVPDEFEIVPDEFEIIPDVVVSISPSTVKSPAPGEPLVLSINITGGENVAGYELKLDFDSTALRYVSGSNADYLPAGAFVIPPLVNADQVRLAATSLNGGSQGAGTLATVTFEVIAIKPSALLLSEVRLTDTDANFLPVRTENAEVVE